MPIGCAALVLTVCALIQTEIAAATTNAPTATSGGSQAYVGSSSCRECHERFYELWAPSHHGLAMQPFTAQLSRSQLQAQKAPIVIGPTSYRADVDQGRVLETGPGGEKSYPIAHTMGGKNVYYFLTPLERGRLQVLPVAYDVRRKEWFDMAASAVRHLGGHADSPLDWRESPLTFNTACFNCHVSQLSKNYDLATDSYRTKWAEPGINCETCHGPGAEHIEAARATPPGETLADLKLIVTSAFSPDQMNSLCGSCHGKVAPITSAFAPGERFFDHFGLTALEHEDFYPDGRDLGENFTFTTWRMSPCVKSGKLDCTHCHTSSGRYRFEGAQANHACLPCHTEQVDAPEAHSRHKTGTDGAKCVSCHMPVTEFARMLRSDHSMRPPMPSLSLAHKSPNACNLCHTDMDAAWSDRTVLEWHGDDYQAKDRERAALIAAARKRDWSALPTMVTLLASSDREEIWAASLLQLLRSCEDERKWSGIKPCLEDSSPLVRAAAIDAYGDALSPSLIPPVLAATRDSYRLVRIRAAAALASMPREMVPAKDRAALQSATDELEASLLARPDDSGSHYNLGNFHMEQRAFPKAISAFQTAVKLQPNSVAPLVNVSLAYNAIGQNAQAEASLRRALSLDPTNAVSNLNFAMLMAELGKLADAEKAFRTAFSSDPQSAVAAFNLGVLLAGDQPEEALVWSRRAVALRPREPKYAYTLAFFLAQRGKIPEAETVLEKTLATSPAHAESYALLGQLYERRSERAKAAAFYRKASQEQQLPEPVRQHFAARANSLSQ